jgi:hypothetical protein
MIFHVSSGSILRKAPVDFDAYGSDFSGRIE